MERTDHPVTTWRTSTYSGANGGNCVEVATSATTILIRDTTQSHLGPARPVLSVSPKAWRHFTQRFR